MKFQMEEQERLSELPDQSLPLEQRDRDIYSWLFDDSARDENPTDLFEGVPNDLEDDIGMTLAQYRDTITNSPAYEWLFSKIHSDLYMMPTEPNIMQDISDQLLRKLSREAPLFRQVSRSRSPHLCAMDFCVKWNPLSFLLEQGYEEPHEQALARAITLTGSGGNVQALTAEQYLKQTFSRTGEEFLALFQDLVRSGNKEAGLSTQSCVHALLYF